MSESSDSSDSDEEDTAVLDSVTTLEGPQAVAPSPDEKAYSTLEEEPTPSSPIDALASRTEDDDRSAADAAPDADADADDRPPACGAEAEEEAQEEEGGDRDSESAAVVVPSTATVIQIGRQTSVESEARQVIPIPVQGSASDSDDTADDEELSQQEWEWRMRRIRQRGRRGPVLAERWYPPAVWAAFGQPKSESQMEWLQAALSKLLMFRDMDQEDLKEVTLAIKGPKTIRKGDVVMRQGQFVPATDPAFYVFEAGQLQSYRADAGAAFPGVPVATYREQGEVFGDLAMMHNAPRPYTVLAETDCVLWWLDRETCNHCVKGAHFALRHEREAFLAEVSILASLSSEERAAIADVMYSRTYSKGDQIIKKGDPGNEFYMVISGSVYVRLPNHKKVKEYGYGDYFGELALLTGQPRAADVFADATPTRLFILHVSGFRSLLGSLDRLMTTRAQAYSRDIFRKRTAKKRTQSGTFRNDKASQRSISIFRSMAMGTFGGVGMGRASIASMASTSPDSDKVHWAPNLGWRWRGSEEPDWVCEDKKCSFQNLPRYQECIKCGLPRPPPSEPGSPIPLSTQILEDADPVPKPRLSVVIGAGAATSSSSATAAPGAAAAGGGPTATRPLASEGVEVSHVRDDSLGLGAALAADGRHYKVVVVPPGQGPGAGREPAALIPGNRMRIGASFQIRYPERRTEVGLVQGQFPLAPGECFQVLVRCCGTFGEVGLGLSPLRLSNNSTRQAGANAEPEESDAGGDESTPSRPTFSKLAGAMVGWAPDEVGFHGDHGRWYLAGKCPGEKVSPPWEPDDVLECGLTARGAAYFSRNGLCVAQAEGFWPVANAYPTVTVHSAGAELVISLHGVAEKSLQGLAGAAEGLQSPRSSFKPRTAWDLLAAFKKTVVQDAKRKGGEHITVLERWLGACGCVTPAPCECCSTVEASR